MKEQNSEEMNALEMEQVKNTVERIGKVLEEDGMVLEFLLEGFPYQIRPTGRVVKKKDDQVQTV